MRQLVIGRRRFQPVAQTPAAGELEPGTGEFRFGADFYQPNPIIALFCKGPQFFLRWPSSEVSPHAAGRGRFIDRSYWEEVSLERDPAGRPVALIYGRFRGAAVKQ